MKLTYSLLSVSLTLLLLAGCNPEYLDPDNIKAGGINPIFAIPLAEASLTIDDLLAKDTNDIRQLNDPNGTFLALIYSDSLRATSAGEFFTLDSYSESNTTSLNAVQITAFQTTGTITITNSFPLAYDPGQGVDVTSIVFKSGDLNIDLTTDFRHIGQVIISIPSLISSGGVAYTSTLNFDGTGSVPATDVDNTDLSGYTLDLSAGNDIDVEFEFTMTNSGNTTLPTDDLVVNFNLVEPDYSLIEGDFKNLDASFPTDSVLMRIFGNFNGGTFTLTNPTVTFSVANSFGIPFRFTFNDLYTSNVNSGEERDLLVQGVPSTINVVQPTTPGLIVTSEREFNNDNTNGAMSSVIEPTPKYVIYDIGGEANPDSPNGNNNFITDQSRLDVVADVLLPLEGYAEATLTDTLTYAEFLTPEQAENIETLLLRVIIDNGFPLEAEMEAYVANFNEETNTMDTLLQLIGGTAGKQVIIAGAPVDPQTFKVTQSINKTTDLTLTSNGELNGEKIDEVKLLAEGNRILISTNLYTTGYSKSETVKIYSDYKISVKMGLKVGAALNVEDL